MRIEVKNVQVNHAMSNETQCFSASLYIDGKRVGTVMNRGCGGCHRYEVDRDVMVRLGEYAKSLPERKVNLGGEEYSLSVDPDTLVDDALSNYECDRLAKKNWVFVSDKEPGTNLAVLKSVPVGKAKQIVEDNYPGQGYRLYNKEGE